MSRNLNLFIGRTTTDAPAPDFEFPRGFRAKRWPAGTGLFIGDMTYGQKFVAPDGKLYTVSRVPKTVRCAGGVAEFDVWAKREGDGKEFHFHAPVGANPNKFTFQPA